MVVQSEIPDPVQPVTGLSAGDRERMILKFAPMVRYIVGRMMLVLPPTLDIDDLMSQGTIGLIEAVDRFDLSHGVSFQTYATGRIRGSIIDTLRAADWVPRTARKRAREIQSTFVQLQEQLGRPPEDEEIATAMGISVTQMQRALADSLCSIDSLDRVVRAPDDDDGHTTLMDLVATERQGPGEAVEQQELHQQVVEAIQRLDERERLVLSLYYERALTLREIGAVLDLSESRVWQIHARAMLRLRAYVEGETTTKKRKGERS